MFATTISYPTAQQLNIAEFSTQHSFDMILTAKDRQEQSTWDIQRDIRDDIKKQEKRRRSEEEERHSVNSQVRLAFVLLLLRC